jgi:hypothetical protein
VLVGGGWKVTIDAVEGANRLVTALRRDGGYAITHVAEITREDGSRFDAPALLDALYVLGYALTFARSAWSFPALVGGYGLVAEPQWLEWGSPRLEGWVGRLTWYAHNHPEPLARVFAGLWRRWLDPACQSVLRVALAFDVEANGEVSPESRLVLSQAALELLAWQRLVNEGRLSSTKFNELSAAEQVSQLLTVSLIDPGLPSAAASLASATSIGSPVDGPAAVIAIRKRIAHPPRSSRHTLLPSDVVVTGWRLALTYIHLVLLRWFDYTGQFISAVDLTPHDMSAGVVHL